MKYSFFDIYPESAHSEILQYVVEHNLDHFVDPDEDQYILLGAERIKQSFGLNNVDIHYFPNGTNTNVTGLSSMLQPYEGVICPSSGHINNYETGGLEASGYKIIGVNAPDGKLTTKLIDKALEHYKGYHSIMPKVVYLTQVTEEGTVYTKEELIAVISHAKSKGLYTYLDGARLGMALASETANMSLEEFGGLELDMFYIGGTKNGGLYGEALVIKNDKFKPHFSSYMKQHGADMSKKRPISLQFARFFDEDNLWLKLAQHANSMAEKLRRGLGNIDSELVISGQANHVFIMTTKNIVEKLEQSYDLARWQKIDDTNIKIRLVCSWSTQSEKIEEFLKTFGKLLAK